MSGRYAGIVRAVFGAGALQPAPLALEAGETPQHLLTVAGGALEPLAVAREVDAQLLLRREDGAWLAGLRGVRCLDGLGQARAAPGGVLHEAELTQLYAGPQAGDAGSDEAWGACA